MPLTPAQKTKLRPDFVATLCATGEAIIAAKIPESMAYAIRDELPFEAWPDDAIEATARFVAELRKRIGAANPEARELLEQVTAAAAASSSDAKPEYVAPDRSAAPAPSARPIRKPGKSDRSPKPTPAAAPAPTGNEHSPPRSDNAA